MAHGLGGRTIELNLKPPTFRSRLRSGPVNYVLFAAIFGLIGTWILGTTIESNGSMQSYDLSIDIAPTTFVITFLWGVMIFYWCKGKYHRSKKYRLAVEGKSDFLTVDDFGVTWGFNEVTSTRVAWSAIPFYRLSRKDLELGLPAGNLLVPIDEFESVEIDKLEALFQSKGVTKVTW